MKTRKILEHIFLFFIMSFSIFAARASGGIGDLDITINLSPVGKTKLYNISDKTVLDTGVYNSQSPLIKEQVIATVDVIMEPKKWPKENENSSLDYCIIDGDFNGILRYRELGNSVEKTSIPLSLKKYNGADKVTMKLKSSNYIDKGTQIQNEDKTDQDYAFTAYPTECNFSNMITRLHYSFDLVLDIENIKNGDIIGGTVKIEASTGKGAVKDLVIAHMNGIMTGSNR